MLLRRLTANTLNCAFEPTGGCSNRRPSCRGATAGAARRKSACARYPAAVAASIPDSMPILHTAQNASGDSHNENALTELAAERSLHPISSFAARGAGAGGGTAACRSAMISKGAYSAVSRILCSCDFLHSRNRQLGVRSAAIPREIMRTPLSSLSRISSRLNSSELNSRYQRIRAEKYGWHGFCTDSLIHRQNSSSGLEIGTSGRRANICRSFPVFDNRLGKADRLLMRPVTW